MCVHHITPLTPLIGLSSKESTRVAHNHLVFISFFNSMSVTVKENEDRVYRAEWGLPAVSYGYSEVMVLLLVRSMLQSF